MSLLVFNNYNQDNLKTFPSSGESSIFVDTNQITLKFNP